MTLIVSILRSTFISKQWKQTKKYILVIFVHFRTRTVINIVPQVAKPDIELWTVTGYGMFELSPAGIRYQHTDCGIVLPLTIVSYIMKFKIFAYNSLKLLSAGIVYFAYEIRWVYIENKSINRKNLGFQKVCYVWKIDVMKNWSCTKYFGSEEEMFDK